MITLDMLRARHAELTAEREREREQFNKREAGYFYTLGELDQMIVWIEAQKGVDHAQNTEPVPAEPVPAEPADASSSPDSC